MTFIFNKQTICEETGFEGIVKFLRDGLVLARKFPTFTLGPIKSWSLASDCSVEWQDSFELSQLDFVHLNLLCLSRFPPFHDH